MNRRQLFSLALVPVVPLPKPRLVRLGKVANFGSYGPYQSDKVPGGEHLRLVSDIVIRMSVVCEKVI